MNDEPIRQNARDHAVQIANVENLSFHSAVPRYDVPCQAEPLPPYYVERPVELARIRNSLRAAAKARSSALVISAIHGLGGIGNTTLAAALAEKLRDEFPGGTLWAKLGQNPDLLSAVTGWIRALGDHQFRAPNVAAASAHLRTLLRDRRVLLVIDDAWTGDAVRPFLAGGPGCVTIVTTRRESVAEEIGAQLESVDVLTRDQSLDLLALRLGRPLRDDERAAASSLAKAVGDLPMALELAATQMIRRRGLTWQKLTSEISGEIARLEALDNAEDQIKGYVKLEATFNTSLHHVRAQSELVWECFVWLGVTMEDSTIAAPTAATLWGVAETKSEQVLQYLRSEALLVFAGMTTVGDREHAAFHIHDLLLDVARRAIVRDRPAGLGIGYADAHHQYLQRVKKQARRGWSSVQDDGYVLQHLSWHMTKSNHPELLDELLREETQSQQNAWYVRRVRAGHLGGYVEDVFRAWDASERTDSLAADGFYALIRSTVNSLTDHLPPTLLARMMAARKWTAVQAVTYAMHIPDPRRRAAALLILLPVIGPALRADALRALMKWIDESLLDPLRGRSNARDTLQSLAHYIPVEDMWVLMRFQENDRAAILAEAAPRLSREQTMRALELAGQISNDVLRWKTMLALAPALPAAEARTVFRQAQTALLAMPVRYTWDLLETVALLAPEIVTQEHLHRLSRLGAERVVRRGGGKLPKNALGNYTIARVKRDLDRATVDFLLLVRPLLWRYISGPLEQVVAQQMVITRPVEVLATALSGFASGMSEDRIRELIDSLDAYHRGHLLLGAVLGNPKLPSEWQDEAKVELKKRSIGESSVALITSSLRESNREVVEKLVPVFSRPQRLTIYAALIAAFPERQSEYLGPFLALLEKEPDQDQDAHLSRIAGVLNSASASLVLHRMRGRSRKRRADLLLTFAPRLTRTRDLLAQILTECSRVPGFTWSVRQVESLLRLFPAEEMVRLRAHLKTDSPSESVEVLLAIARACADIPSDVVKQIFTEFELVTGDRFAILESMSRVLRDDDLLRILDGAQQVGSVSDDDLAAFLREDDLPSRPGAPVSGMMEAASPDLPKARLPVVPESPSVVSAIAIPDPAKRAVALSQHLLSQGAVSQDTAVAAFMTLTRIHGTAEQLKLLRTLLPKFDDALIALVADWLLTRPASERGLFLTLLLPHLTPVTFPEAFRVWVSLGPSAISYSEPFLEKVPDYWVLQAIQSLRRTPDDLRAHCIVKLVRRVLPSELPSVAAEVASIENAFHRQRGLTALARVLVKMPPLQRRAIGRTLVRMLSVRSREDVFFDIHALAPLIARDGDAAVAELRQHAALVYRWWK